MPEWTAKFRKDGLSELEIKEKLRDKAAKYTEKWGNSSKVGLLLNSFDSQQAVQ